MYRNSCRLICNSLKNLHNHLNSVNNAQKTCLRRNVSIFDRPSNLNVVSATANVNGNFIRHYAKGKDKKKEKGKGKVHVDETQLAELINLVGLKSQMQKALDSLKDDFTKNLSIRSTAGSIESIVVNVDGEEHTLQELAQIVRKNPKLVVINMAVFPQVIPAALEAIAKSGMNLNPQQEGTTLYIPVPKVTKEHRENLAKNAKQLFIKCKDSVRDLQTKQAKSLKKKEGVSEDSIRNAEKQIITIADGFIHQAEEILKTKQSELLGKD